MFSGIDWNFLLQQEARILNGYIPKKDGKVIGKSGVTVGLGIDLGQRSSDQIKRLDLSGELKAKLIPYAGKRMDEAERFLRDNPLRLTSEEVDELKHAVAKADLVITVTLYNRDSMVDFRCIPNQAKTVIASLAWNFGPNLARAIPRTWKALTAQNWKLAAEILNDFPGKQPELDKRRKREAALLAQIP